MGHDDGDNIKDYRLTNEFYYTPFYLCHETWQASARNEMSSFRK
jgi:hypothetical protein